MKRVARVWVAFTLFGGLIGLGCFLSLVFGVGVSEPVAAAISVPLGVTIGYGLARLVIARRLAARLLAVLYEIGWLTS